MKPMRNLTNIPESDECYTPSGQIKYILKYIPKEVKTIWCPFDTAESNIVKDLKQAGYDVIHTHISDGFDFFKYQPIPNCYDCIISNPPYRFKTQVLERCYELDKPFFLLLPLTALEGKERNKLFTVRGINVIVNANRIDFTGKGKAWFNTSWFFGNHPYVSNVLIFENNEVDNGKNNS